MSFDLHTHTTASDGLFTPAQLVEMAHNLGLTGIAISDHDTVDGLDEGLAKAKELGFKLVPAVELSCKFEDYPTAPDVHMLGYFIDHNEPNFRERLAYLQEKRRDRAAEILDRLDKNGIHLNREILARYAEAGSIGRGSIAHLMVAEGWVANMPEAFERWLGDGKPAFVPRVKLTPEDAIKMIHSVGGTAVIAHPALVRKPSIIGRLKAHGLQGLELRHPAHSREDIRQYAALAQEHGLLVTGGSDCHESHLGEYLTDDETVAKILALSSYKGAF